MVSQHISRIIGTSPQKVYDYVRNPFTLPLWAAGLATSTVTEDNGRYFAQAPFGRVQVRFVQTNSSGVLDHEVITENGATFYNPMRVIPHPQGSEIIFTVRQLEMSDEQFAADCRAVAADLETLAQLLER
ncbi:SRPBCC family protein [Rothia terrae]|uniref:SRPBCC family protein n=1 Tax=Rothia terrae TaxID=396015 RepID=UPI001444FD77|nr:SRPBCC family protein [Rothia terrae]